MASDTATTAFLSQTRLDEQLTKYGERLTTEWQRRQVSHAAFLTKLLVEKQLQFTWSVP